MTTMSTTTAPMSSTKRSAVQEEELRGPSAILFVVQMVTAMFGTSLIQAFVDGNPDRAPMTVGVALMACSGLAVVGIGLLMYPVLKERQPNPCRLVPSPRGSSSASFPQPAVSTSWPRRRSSRTTSCGSTSRPASAASSSATCSTSARLVPRPIALLGLVGYASLTIGVPLDLLGVLDMSAGAGMLLVVPGGLFELVFLPVWLIAKGFRPLPSTPDLSSPALATAH